MMATILAFLSTTLGRYLALGGVALLAVGMAYGKGRLDGRDACNERVAGIHREYALASEKERQRQEQINSQALAEAQKQADELTAQNEHMNEMIRKLNDEAMRDSRANGCGVTRDGVRRLNQIR